MERKRVFILVKTYPTISEKYSELVCTAGVLEDGSWIRLYPVPFRLLNEDQKFPKYTWVTVSVERNTSDFRPESYRPDIESIAVEPKPGKADWEERRKIIFHNQTVYTNLHTLIDEAMSPRKTSLAIFKPTKILDFQSRSDGRAWDPKKVSALMAQSRQLGLFQTPQEIEREFRLVRKVPYKFLYRFEDDSGRQSTLVIKDWEIGMLYFNCLRRAKDEESAAIAEVKKKYLDSFRNRDVHFFLGTTKQYHHKGVQNPFFIVGLYYPPMRAEHRQLSMFGPP